MVPSANIADAALEHAPHQQVGGGNGAMVTVAVIHGWQSDATRQDQAVRGAATKSRLSTRPWAGAARKQERKTCWWTGKRLVGMVGRGEGKRKRESGCGSAGYLSDRRDVPALAGAARGCRAKKSQSGAVPACGGRLAGPAPGERLPDILWVEAARQRATKQGRPYLSGAFISPLL
ncbi:hypothetical protein BDY21DRAFT_40952 [Lineolata rhizophorae]|uniref:Uncharacterized protein n=1 Tax=Lineolata rhizophorae TaxID=578093 RepID=A0A6A6NY72_9PEZI|nr:hypothetical protein BDY21DRAFT_40952 [Lineolata rhizophorae]